MQSEQIIIFILAWVMFDYRLFQFLYICLGMINILWYEFCRMKPEAQKQKVVARIDQELAAPSSRSVIFDSINTVSSFYKLFICLVAEIMESGDLVE